METRPGVQASPKLIYKAEIGELEASDSSLPTADWGSEKKQKCNKFCFCGCLAEYNKTPIKCPQNAITRQKVRLITGYSSSFSLARGYTMEVINYLLFVGIIR